MEESFELWRTITPKWGTHRGRDSWSAGACSSCCGLAVTRVVGDQAQLLQSKKGGGEPPHSETYGHIGIRAECT